MRVTRLRLRDFRRHAELTIEPAPGLTVIRGPNEAGKTTIQRALELALFRRVTSADEAIRDTRRWGSGDQDAPEVELDFEADGTSGRLVKSFKGSKGTVTLSIGDRQTNDPATADEWITEVTGIPTEKFFRSTASVSHHEIMRLDRDEANLRDRLQQSISGADRGVSAARKRLDDAIKGLRASGPKNPGPVKRAEDERSRLAEELQRGEEALARLERDREAHGTAVAQREAADIAIAEAREQLAQAELAAGLAAEKARADERYEKYRRAAEFAAQISALEQSHPSRIALSQLREQVQQLRALATTIAECIAALGADEGLLEWTVPEPRWRHLFWRGLGLAIGGLVVLGLESWSRVLNAGLPAAIDLLVVLIGSLLVVGGAGVLLIAYRRRDSRADLLVAHQMRQEAIERRLRGRSDTEDALHRAEASRGDILAAMAQESSAAAEELLAAEEEHVHKLEEVHARYGELMHGETIKDVAKARDDAAAESERKAAALLGMGEIGRDPAGHRDRFEAHLRTLQSQREAALREEAATGERVAQNAVDAVEVAATAEALALATERLAALLSRQRIYEVTLAALDKAEQATMKKATAYLEQRMAADVEHLTGGRYRKVQVADELQISLWSQERGDWVPVSALSQGTIDQVYLAARIELVRLVTQDRRPPLIFDDPFVTYDDERASRAVGLLHGLTDDHQIFYLTTSSRYDDVADKVIELPGPVGARQPRRA